MQLDGLQRVPDGVGNWFSFRDFIFQMRARVCVVVDGHDWCVHGVHVWRDEMENKVPQKNERVGKRRQQQSSRFFVKLRNREIFQQGETRGE